MPHTHLVFDDELLAQPVDVAAACLLTGLRPHELPSAAESDSESDSDADPRPPRAPIHPLAFLDPAEGGARRTSDRPRFFFFFFFFFFFLAFRSSNHWLICPIMRTRPFRIACRRLVQHLYVLTLVIHPIPGIIFLMHNIE
jgi:hypothetical protein